MESGNQPSIFKDLLVTHTMGNHLHDTTKWCRFLSIVLIVCIALFLLVAIVAGSAILPVMNNALPGVGNLLGNFMLVVAFVIFLVFGALTFFLLRFAIFTRRGLEMRNQTLFNEGLKALKIYFIIYGVWAVLYLLYSAFGLVLSF